MNSKILFIHGLASCGNGNKVSQLKSRFGEEAVVAPDLPVEPALAVNILEALYEEISPGLLVGSSLGGFYAVHLNGVRPVPTVVINPAVRPWVSLDSYLGTHEHWCTGETFELTPDHLAQWKKLARKPRAGEENYLALIARDDEVLDASEMGDFFKAFQVRLVEGDNHRFEQLPRYLDDIQAFRDQTRQATDRGSPQA